jgi:hypothetical protein
MRFPGSFMFNGLSPLKMAHILVPLPCPPFAVGLSPESFSRQDIAVPAATHTSKIVARSTESKAQRPPVNAQL